MKNNTGSDMIVDIFIGNWEDLAAPVEFDMFLLCGGCFNLGNGNILDYNTSGSSVVNQGDAAGSPAKVVSVGAVPASSPGTLESFSSLGLTNDGRNKPEISAPDGVSITGAGGFPSPFFGTSAAAPHVAGVAALILDCDPFLGRLDLHDRLIDNAVDLGAAGTDNFFGAGRIDALASANDGGCDSATPTVTNTPLVTNTPTSTPSATATPTDTATPTKQPDPGDTDQDGCTDVAENGPNEVLGGRRDYANFWDFFDTPDGANVRNKMIDLFGDVFGVALRFGATGDPNDDPLAGPILAPPVYHTAFDRSAPPPGGDPWDLQAADGTIDLFNDIFGVAFQFGHMCAAPP